MKLSELLEGIEELDQDQIDDRVRQWMAFRTDELIGEIVQGYRHAAGQISTIEGIPTNEALVQVLCYAVAKLEAEVLLVDEITEHKMMMGE